MESWRWWNFSWAISNPERWCCESAALNIPANLENWAVATGLEKVSFHSNPKERRCQTMFKLPHNYSHASKVMLKILQARLQQYVNHELSDFQAGTSIKQESSRKTSISGLLTILKLWLCRSQYCGKFFKRWDYQTTWSASWEICMQFRKQQLELDMEQQTGSQLGKEYIKAVYCHLAYWTYTQSTECEMPGWSTSWNQDCQDKYQ